MLTKERAELLANYLAADQDRAQALLELSPEEAVAKINADGNDFTVEEVKEFGETLQKVTKTGELNENELEDVSGGVIGTATAIAIAKVLGTGFACKVAYDVGKIIGKNAPW